MIGMTDFVEFILYKLEMGSKTSGENEMSS